MPDGDQGCVWRALGGDGPPEVMPSSSGSRAAKSDDAVEIDPVADEGPVVAG
jgi:hypothetical protein